MNINKNIIALVLFVVLICFMAFYIWIYNHTHSLLDEIAELRHQEASIATQNRILSVELQNLSRTDRIKQIASEQLNMTTPIPETLAVVINEEIIN